MRRAVSKSEFGEFHIGGGVITWFAHFNNVVVVNKTRNLLNRGQQQRLDPQPHRQSGINISLKLAGVDVCVCDLCQWECGYVCVGDHARIYSKTYEPLQFLNI